MSAWGQSWKVAWANSWGLVSALSLNTEATTDVPVNYLICDRTGFKLYARGLGSGVMEFDGSFVRPKSHELPNPQRFQRSHSPDNFKGPRSPEPNDVFTSGDIDPDKDL